MGIPNDFGGWRQARVKKWNMFISEHFWGTNLIAHVTLRIKVKKKYCEWIWLFDAREGKKMKYVFENTTTQRKKNHHANTPDAVKN